MPDSGVSLATRVEITKKYAVAYEGASKKDKSRILDQLVGVTGWNRDHARQQLRRGVKQAPGRAVATVAVMDRRRTKPRKYSYDAVRVLQRVWAAAGDIVGKYLAASMASWLDAIEATTEGFGDLAGRYDPTVRGKLEAMSPATIDRYLAPIKARDPLRGKSTTKPGSLLRKSISMRKAGDEMEAEPGFFEVDTVAHSGPSLEGEFVRTVNFTDMYTGWVFTRAVRNNSSVHIRSAFDALVTTAPFMVTGIDCDNGSELMNHDLIDWAGKRKILFTRSRPYKSNDQATIESKTTI